MVVVLLSSCNTIRQVYHRPDGITDGIFRDMEEQDSVNNIATIPWNDFFTDPTLQSLIGEAINHNFDLQVAVARIKQAEANFKQSKAELLPTLELDANAKYRSEGGFDDYSKQYNLSASAGWELDIWGKLRSSKRASLNAVLESGAYKRAVQTQLVADVASYYYTLLAYDAQMKILEQTVQTYIEDVKSMKLLKENNTATGADLVQSEANRYSAEVSIPELKQTIRETENSMSLLLGRAPGSIERTSLDVQEMDKNLNPGIPSQLLANRPDVREAEFALRYYTEMTNVARAYFYPSLSITAEGGLNNTSMSGFFDTSSLFSNIVGGLTGPVFNQRANRQRLEVARAQQEEYLATFKKTVISAGIEVSNALYAYQIASDKIGLRTKQISFLEKSVDYTKQLMKYRSSTNYTDVLTSEQNLLSARLNNVNDQLARLTAIIDLYRSLGGGI